MVALKKKTGEPVWACTDIADEAGFASATLAEDRGVRQAITMTADNLIGVDADSGKLLWRHPFTNKRRNNIPTPIYRDGFVYASTGYGGGSVCLKLSFDGKSVSATQAWAGKDLDNIHGGILLVDGFLYGSANEKPGWVCLDAKTGLPRYMEKGVGMGSVTCADGMLYCFSEAGTMALVPCTPERHQVVSSFDVPKGGDGRHWAHPVVCGGRLYVRHADCLYAYDIRAK
jgi:outer membrane protein assembly factor BamB